MTPGHPPPKGNGMASTPSAPSATVSTKALPFLALILGSACLAFGPLLVRVADVSPIASVFWRLGLATPLLLLVALVMARRDGRWGGGGGASFGSLKNLPWGLAALAGLFFGADLPAWHLGIMQTTSANATLFGNGAAFMLAGWALIWGGEAPDRRNLSALGLALLGTLLLLGASARISVDHLVGDLLCLLGTSLYTGYLIILIRLRSEHPTATILGIATGIAALVVLPMALLWPGNFWPQDWTPVIIYALSSQFIGQGLVIYATGSLSATVIGIGLLVQPILSALIGWSFFGEIMNPAQAIGAAFVCAALVLVRR